MWVGPFPSTCGRAGGCSRCCLLWWGAGRLSYSQLPSPLTFAIPTQLFDNELLKTHLDLGPTPLLTCSYRSWSANEGDRPREATGRSGWFSLEFSWKWSPRHELKLIPFADRNWPTRVGLLRNRVTRCLIVAPIGIMVPRASILQQVGERERWKAIDCGPVGGRYSIASFVSSPLRTAVL